MKNRPPKGRPLSEREQSLAESIRRLTKRTVINEPGKRHGFVELNANQARHQAQALHPHEVLLVLGLDCPVAQSLAMALTGRRNFPKIAAGMETTLWLVGDRMAVARVYESLWGGVAATVSALREATSPLVLFVANGGTSSVLNWGDASTAEAVSP